MFLHRMRRFTTQLSYDLQILFVAPIPSYEKVQTSLYQISRQFIPPAPVTQTELNVDLDWFLVSHDPDESLVKGDVIVDDTF